MNTRTSACVAVFPVQLGMGHIEAVGRVPQKDHSQNRHEIIAGSKLGICPQIIGGFPKIGLEFFDILECVVAHNFLLFQNPSIYELTLILHLFQIFVQFKRTRIHRVLTRTYNPSQSSNANLRWLVLFPDPSRG
jgi:hypothetical protein